MKLKVKLTSQPERVLKIEVDSAATLTDAQQVIAREANTTLPAHAVLSLNKKTPVSADSGITLAAAGICSGDLVWVLNGQPTGAPAPTTAAKPAASPQGTQGPAADTSAGTPPAAHSAPQPETSKRPRSDAGTEQAMDVNAPYVAHEVVAPPVEVTHLSRLLAQVPPTSSPLSPAQVLMLAVQAALLEVGFDMKPVTAHHRASTSTQHSTAAGAPHPQQQQQPQQAATAAVPDFTSGACRLELSSRWACDGTRESPKCSVSATPMGRFLVVHAKAVGLPTGSTPALAAKPCVRTVHLDSHAAVDLGPLQESKGPLTPGVFKDLRSLWLLLKDDLALWALSAAHQAAGLPPPVGLLALPFELKDKILASLEVKTLSVVSCVCMELRQLADADHLWKPAFLSEFPNASLEERSMAERVGYKRAFIVLWQARKERQQRARARSHLRPTFPSPMPGPLFPSRGPTYPPHIIGGDYDRLPGGPGFGGMSPSFGLLGGGGRSPLPGSGDPLMIGGPRRGGGPLHGPQGLLGPGPFGRRGGGARGEAGFHFFE